MSPEDERVDPVPLPVGATVRGTYADFLEEAAELLSRPALRKAAADWRVAAEAWEEIVHVALPPGDELRSLIDRASAAIAHGDPAAADVTAARWALQAERDLAGEMPPLADPVAAMHAAEVAALAGLAETLR